MFYNEFDRQSVTVKAKIKGKIHVIELAAKGKNDYDDLVTVPIEYLGQGKYHSYNDTPAKDNKLYHFWRFKNEKTE